MNHTPQIYYNASVPRHSDHCGLSGEQRDLSGVAWQALAAQLISFQAEAEKGKPSPGQLPGDGLRLGQGGWSMGWGMAQAQ